MDESRDNVEDDLPDDFFDEFSNSEFLSGLNVVDAWEKPRVLEDDLRDLLRSRKEEAARTSNDSEPSKYNARRDPAKTSRDIKRDKEAKLKEHLAKRIHSPAGPPGTELDDFEYDRKQKKKTPDILRNRSPVAHKHSPVNQRSRSSHRRRSPSHHHRSPHRRSPRATPRQHSPRRPHRSPIPFRSQRSPLPFRKSPLPFRRSPMHRRSPLHRRNRSPSPRRERRMRRSRSRSRRSRSRSRRSRSSSRSRLSLAIDHPGSSTLPAYTPMFTPGVNDTGYPTQYGQSAYQPSFPAPETYYPTGMVASGPQTYYPPQNFSYQQGQPAAQYYTPGAVPPPLGHVPQPVPAPLMPSPVQPVHQPIPSNQEQVLHHIGLPTKTAVDSLDQLLESGKISKEDYLKLRPKSHPAEKMDLQEKVKVLSRCHDAVTKLAKLHLPNKLIMSNMYKIPEQKAIVSKYCSPLKRQPLIHFNFTSAKNSTYQANKQLVDSIVATVGLQDAIMKSVQKKNSNSKDVSCQTTIPFCEECEIRKLTKCNEKKTSIDAEYFTSSVHTQVIEAELASSKTTFNVGNMSDGGAMSLSHLTPAQLIVSQLAARAKKLEQVPSEDPDLDHYTRRAGNSHSSYYASQMYQNHRY